MSGALIALVIAAIVIFFWLDGARARELATGIARTLCERRGVQFLDQTVQLERLGLRWGASGIRFRRMFVFDYSTEGLGRSRGYLILVGTDVEQFAPADTTDEQDAGSSRGEAEKADGKDNVIPFRGRKD